MFPLLFYNDSEEVTISQLVTVSSNFKSSSQNFYLISLPSVTLKHPNFHLVRQFDIIHVQCGGTTLLHQVLV